MEVKAGVSPGRNAAGRLAMAACTRAQKTVIQELEIQSEYNRANITGRLVSPRA